MEVTPTQRKLRQVMVTMIGGWLTHAYPSVLADLVRVDPSGDLSVKC